MDNSAIIDFLTKLSQVATDEGQKNKPQTFKEQTQIQKPTVANKSPSKPKQPSTDAIIKMIQSHNILRTQIIEQSNKNC